MSDKIPAIKRVDSPREISVDDPIDVESIPADVVKKETVNAPDRQLSMPSHHTDPFATREGKTLVWKDINMKLAGKKDEPDRQLLNNVWGEVPQHNTTAIMGPSGAGKTSLLNILAGRAASRGRVTISSDVRLNNYSVDPTNINVRKQIAFVAQDDSLQVTSTPREAIRFSAKLRLPRHTSEHDLDKLTERMITELGLTSCADTIVGGALIKGISGGERKRASVGVELVVKPALVFLDEPTSGLDSFSAVQLCQVLKKVANAGASVLFTIHQPSSEIFNSFDHLILLNKGRVMYQGPVQGVPSYFAERQHPNPPNYNPADWIMNVAQSVSIEELDNYNFFPKDQRGIGEAFTPEEGKDALGITITRRPKPGDDDYDQTPPGMGTQTSLLFTREINNLRRDVTALGARFGLTIFLGVLIGIIFFEVGDKNKYNVTNVQSHFGAAIMVLMMSMFGTAQPALLSFPEERPVFLREYSTSHYSVMSYFVSRLAMEAFITLMQVLVMGGFLMFTATTYSLAMSSTALAVLLGCAVEDPKLGQEMLPILFVPQMLFAGFFVTPDLIPVFLRWARYLCSLTYAVRIVLVSEFEDCADDQIGDRAAAGLVCQGESCSGGNCTFAPCPCQTVMTNVEADPDETWWNWLILVVLFVGFRLGALAVLRSKATKFF